VDRLYSTNGGSVWTLTEPAPASVTNIRWLLDTTIALDGGHDGDACLANDGLYDNGTLSTSLPPGKTIAVRFQVTVNSNGGPVVCNTAGLTFGGSATSTTAQDCTIVTGNNTLSGNVFQDTGAGAGIFGNGTQDGTEPGIGAGVVVTLYYDLDGDGLVGSGDLVYASTTTSAAGAYSFSNLADGPYLVVIKKYDGATSDGSTTPPPTAPSARRATGTRRPIRTCRSRRTGHPQTQRGSHHGDAGGEHRPRQSQRDRPVDHERQLRLRAAAARHKARGAESTPTPTDGRHGHRRRREFTYSIVLENRLPSAGVQGRPAASTQFGRQPA
jgi:hypothetical protein